MAAQRRQQEGTKGSHGLCKNKIKGSTGRKELLQCHPLLDKNSVVYMQQFLITSGKKSKLFFGLPFATLLPLQQSFLKGCLLLSLDGKSNALHMHVFSAPAFFHDQVILQRSYTTISNSRFKASPRSLQIFIQHRTSETENILQLHS